MRIGIDLTWVKPQISGGIEFFARNLLDGFVDMDSMNYCYILFLSEDNYDSFLQYGTNQSFHLVKCHCLSKNVISRLVWQNLFFNHTLSTHGIDVCLTPFYSIPLLKHKSCKTIAVIHDLQALHYPEYFSKIKLLWLKLAWKRTLYTSDIIVAISNFVKEDIVQHYGSHLKDKIHVIYNPIKVNSFIEHKDRQKKSYFYTICSPFKHKNFKTLVYLLKEIRNNYPEYPQILWVSGMKQLPTEIKEIIKKEKLEENIKLTGYISNEERDRIMANASIFLFPSLFEGFGMPVVEALMLGTPVITTNTTSIPEVSCGKAVYVERATDIGEWMQKIKNVLMKGESRAYDFPQYQIHNISRKYIALIESLQK